MTVPRPVSLLLLCSALLFVLRGRRRVGSGDGETVHLSIRERMAALPRYRPRGLLRAPEGKER